MSQKKGLLELAEASTESLSWLFWETQTIVSFPQILNSSSVCHFLHFSEKTNIFLGEVSRLGWKKQHNFQCHPIFQLIKFHELNDISGLTVFLKRAAHLLSF